MQLRTSRCRISYKIMNSPLFIILLLAAFAASTTFLFKSWRDFCHLNNNTESSLIRYNQTPVMMLNDTVLLALASIDLSDERTTSDVTELLTENFHRLRMSYWLWCVHNIVLRLKSTELKSIMVNVKKDLVNWSDRRHSKSQSTTPLLLNSAKLPHYTSCAVVGNSGILLHSQHGDLIDSHEAVIRVKNAKVNGFEKHVGTKTNISFINSNTYTKCAWEGNCNCNPYSPNTTLITYISQPIHFLDISLCKHTSIIQHIEPALLVTDPEFDEQCGRIVKYYSLKLWMKKNKNILENWSSAHEGMLFHYSTGMQAVMLALRVCGRVSLFGFGKGKSNSTKHHYYRTDQKSELRLHDYDAEYELYSELTRSHGSGPFLDKEFKVPEVLWYR